MNQELTIPQRWSLSVLLADSGTACEGIMVTGVTCDSRQVTPGVVFVALSGSNADGARFIPQAVAAGASAIICQEGAQIDSQIGISDAIDIDNIRDGKGKKLPVIFHPNPRRLYAHLCAMIYPKQPEFIAAVTGTNGKTSVVHFLRQLWQHIGYNAASLGTLGVASSYATEGAGKDSNGDSVANSVELSAPSQNNDEYDSTILQGLTTADPLLIHRALDHLARKEITHLALEASSHGLDQNRLDEVNISVAALTQMSRDHLDYHGDFESYQAAKIRLFSECLLQEGVAVINTGGAYMDAFREASKQRKIPVLEVGKGARDLSVVSVERDGFSQHAFLKDADDRNYKLKVNLVGEFQVENILCAIGLALACENISQLSDKKTHASLSSSKDLVLNKALLQRLLQAAEYVTSVPGRMERMGESSIFVDYAHTPDALEHALKELRPYTKGRLWVVFGCGGNRDKGKRAMMGKIAHEYADQVVVTDDNPRQEEPSAIRQDILKTCSDAIEIGARLEAITYAYSEMSIDDVLLIAGKGHEDYQIIGGTKHPCDDRAHVLDLLNADRRA